MGLSHYREKSPIIFFLNFYTRSQSRKKIIFEFYIIEIIAYKGSLYKLIGQLKIAKDMQIEVEYFIIPRKIYFST